MSSIEIIMSLAMGTAGVIAALGALRSSPGANADFRARSSGQPSRTARPGQQRTDVHGYRVSAAWAISTNVANLLANHAHVNRCRCAALSFETSIDLAKPYQ